MRVFDRSSAAAAGTTTAVVLALAAIGLGIADGSWLLAALGGFLLWIIVVLVVIRFAGLNERLGDIEREMKVDAITELPNLDHLVEDLDEVLADADQRTVLSVYLLDGIKSYTDAYGRACGDVLLSWLASKLRAAVAPTATAYRMRGGEFAVVASGGTEATAAVRAAASTALTEFGEGFVVYPSVGEAVLGKEAQTTTTALKLADHRAHARRRTTEIDVGPQPPEDATEAVGANPSRFDVAELATTVGRAMAVPPDELDNVAAAAHLRDVGNLAVPTVILNNTGDLPPSEWRFIRLHTVVGERLLAANFGMEEVAALVRSSHERWDGNGYPDRLAGEEIPLGSRIVFVCSAFEDMTSARAHREPLTVEDALDELQQGAGTQFDPNVVRALLDAYRSTQDQDDGALASAAHRRLRVLVADDDGASRFLLWRRVEAAGHECVTAEDGHQAWELYDREQPDIVISDSRLPGLDGIELCRRIRARHDARFTYVMIVAALGDERRVQTGMDIGADDFLTKPIVRQDLDLGLVAAARCVALQSHRRRRAAQ